MSNQNPNHGQSQGWQYPIQMGQYGYGSYPIRLSNAASAPVVPVPMAYPQKELVNPAEAHSAQQLAHSRIVNPNVATNAHRQTREDTIVEVPPDQMKELLEIREIKQRRLARKAELARLSRRRNRDMLQSIQEETRKLEDELRMVRAQSVRPCVRCDKRLTLSEISGDGGTDTDVKSTFEMVKLRLPKYEDSLKTKEFLEKSMDRARIFVHRSMVSSLDTFAKERKKRITLSNRPKSPFEAAGGSQYQSKEVEHSHAQRSHAQAQEIHSSSSRPVIHSGSTEQIAQQDEEAPAEDRDLAASSVELEKFLVENLVTQYKRRHLAARFHLAAFEQHMQQSLPVNTLLCYLWKQDEQLGQGGDLHHLFNMKMTQEQIGRANTLRDSIRKLLMQQKELEIVYDILRNELFIDPPPPSNSVRLFPMEVQFISEQKHRKEDSKKIGMHEIRRRYEETWKKCSKEIFSLLTSDQANYIFRWGLENSTAAKRMIKQTVENLSAQLEPTLGLE
mmetsp:Transcript_23405/g.32666  ORF Transcript_23405/g.32666 Transcript_23405/m.32666 type:complete len:504 (-) Transcript_23405:119-1630(-)